jgi:anti-sigma factor ChrR (cupin superfamily)
MLPRMQPELFRLPAFLCQATSEGGAWRRTRSVGVTWLSLHSAREEGDDSGDGTVLIRMDPGSSYPAHRHVGVEQVLVLRGGYRDEWGEHRAGAYLRYPAGSEHHPVALGDAGLSIDDSNPECLLYVVSRGGVSNSSG